MSQFHINLNMWKRFEQQVARMGARGSRFAINDYLNTLAFGARRYYPTQIARDMDVRSPRFVSSSFGVKTSRPRNLIAYTYSIGRERFSGWKEQQRGTGKLREKVGFVRARVRKSESGKIANRFRMNKRSKFHNINDVHGSSPRQRFAVLLKTVREAKGSSGKMGAFIAGGSGLTRRGGSLPWGLWVMAGPSHRYNTDRGYEGIYMLQKFDSPAPTKKNDWAFEGTRRYLAQEDLRGEWTAAYNRSWKDAKKR